MGEAEICLDSLKYNKNSFLLYLIGSLPAKRVRQSSLGSHIGNQNHFFQVQWEQDNINLET